MRNRVSGLVTPVLWLPAEETRFLRQADGLTAGKIPRRLIVPTFQRGYGRLDALASPTPGAQERHGWHSHAERGNDGRVLRGWASTYSNA